MRQDFVDQQGSAVGHSPCTTTGTEASSSKVAFDHLIQAAIDQIFDASEKQMRAAIERVPDGEYQAERLIDHDGVNKDRMIASARS